MSRTTCLSSDRSQAMLGDFFVLFEDFKRDPGAKEAQKGCMTAFVVVALVAGLIHFIVWICRS